MKNCGAYEKRVDEKHSSIPLCGKPAYVAVLVRVHHTLREMQEDAPREPAVLLLCKEHARGLSG